jgi:hypothetical protein
MDTSVNYLNADHQRLVEWVQEKNFDIDSLAAVTGDSYSNIYMMLRGKRPVNDSFKWRFASHFGWAEAERLFGITKTPSLAQMPA